MRIEYKACPLCQSTDLRADKSADCTQHPLWSPALPEKLLWLRCRYCGHSFTSSYWDDRGLELIFARAHDFQTPGMNAESGRAHAARMIERRSILALPEPWLDVGFGAGDLILTAREYGYLIYGIDTREHFVNELSRFGITNISCTNFANYSPPEPIGTIFMLDVLEHMPFPTEALKRAHAMLIERGQIVISCPNIDAPIWQILDSTLNPYWFEIEHHHNFGRTRLEKLLTTLGFLPQHYTISHRYRACMEITARKL